MIGFGLVSFMRLRLSCRLVVLAFACGIPPCGGAGVVLESTQVLPNFLSEKQSGMKDAKPRFPSGRG
jgi:hypothetical protein